MWCAVVFWSVLSLKIWNIYDEKLREAGKWWGRFCNTTNWIKIVSYFPVCTELVIDIEKETTFTSILFACYFCSNDRCTNQISLHNNGIDFDSIATLLGRFCTFPYNIIFSGIILLWKKKCRRQGNSKAEQFVGIVPLKFKQASAVQYMN